MNAKLTLCVGNSSGGQHWRNEEVNQERCTKRTLASSLNTGPNSQQHGEANIKDDILLSLICEIESMNLNTFDEYLLYNNMHKI